VPSSLAQDRRPLPDPPVDLQAADQLSRLRKTSFALTRNRADAEDLVQDAYVRALGASASFRPGTNLKAWLSTILRNLTLNHRRDEFRRHRRFEPIGDDDQIADVAAPGQQAPDAALLGSVIAPQLRSALESMPKSLRDAVWLRDVEEMSYAAIAERLGIPIGTVMSRIARGRRHLHDCLVESSLAPRPARHSASLVRNTP
jgi:RNA polymerase sigma-70 factor (ECF subfamily)